MKKIIIFYAKAFLLVVFLLVGVSSTVLIWYKTKVECNNKTNLDMLQIMPRPYESPAGDYCDLVNKCVLEQDEEAIRELSSLTFSDGATYDHGDVLMQIVQEIGEEKYLKAIKSLPLAKKRGIGGYFEAAKDVGAGDWEKLYPKIYKELDGDFHPTGGFTRPSDDNL